VISFNAPFERPPLNGEWRTSSRSAEGNCIQVRIGLGGTVEVRDSKAPNAPGLSFPPAAWSAFVESLCKQGLLLR
jgi:hypothetical protein